MPDNNIPEHWVLEVQERLGRLSEQMINAADHRREIMRQLNALGDKSDMLSGDVRSLDQVIKSQSALLTPLLLEKCGERLSKLEIICVDIPTMTESFRFWEKMIGGGVYGIIKVIGLLVTSGMVGAVVNHFWPISHG